MKHLRRFLVLVAAFIMSVASCQQAPILTMTGPRSFNFTRDGGSQSFSFTCNRNWSVSSTESWITFSHSSGTASEGDITVKITCAENTTYDARSATVTVKVEELTEIISISQDTGLGLLVSPTTFDLTNAAQEIEIEVQKNVEYSISIDPDARDWITHTGTKGLTSEKLTFSIAANETYDDREGVIAFKENGGPLFGMVVVKQSQTNGLFITKPEYDLSNTAHTLSVEVKANVEFEVTSQADWISYVETKALKASTIALSILANDGYDSRTGTVLVKQKNGDLTGTITITQKQTDYLEVTPNSFDLDNKLHEIELRVTQNVAYSVVIPDDAKNWVYIPTKSATKGLIDDTILLVVDTNTTNDNRETSITIKQNDGSLAETVKIKQDASDEDPQETGLFFSKGVELMCLIWRLAGAPEFNQCGLSKVNKSVNEYFSSMLNHEAVLLAKDFIAQNISYDAVTSFGLHLLINADGTISFNPDYLEYDEDSFFLRWSSQQRELMLKAVNDFYKESRFEEWFDSLNPLFSEAKLAFNKVCEVDYAWYEGFFGTIENPSHQIILSFLIGNNNNGLSVLLKDGSIMSSPVMGSAIESPSGGVIYYSGILEVIIHEFSHPYCNPLITKYWNSMEEKALEVFKVVQGEMVAQAYGTPTTMMCETFVRSSVIRYFLSHFSDYSRNALVSQQEALGFKLVSPFVDALELREKNQTTYPTMDEFMPELIKAMNDYVVEIEAYSGYYPEYTNPSSSYLLPGIFSVGPNSYVQFTKSNVYWNGNSLKFEENPMNYPQEWNPSHIGHFYWTTTLGASIAKTYDEDGQSVSDHLFCDGSDVSHTLSVEGISGLRALQDGQDGEIDYLLKKRANASKLYKYPVNIKGVGNCLVLAPDNYTSSISDSYDAASWTVAEGNGLVCLAPDGRRFGTDILECDGKKSFYWCGGAKEDSPYHAYHFSFSDNIYYYPIYSSRNNGFSLRLVKDVKTE